MSAPAEVLGEDGQRHVVVRVGASRPFAQGLIDEWARLDGGRRGWMLSITAFNVPVEVYAIIAPRVRAKLEAQGIGTEGIGG